MQKRLELVASLCDKLPDDIADEFIREVIKLVINYCFDPITQTLNEENKYAVLETILPFINKIKDPNSFNSLSIDIYRAFLDGGSYYCTDFRKNLLLNNEKEFLKVFVNANPKTFTGVLRAYMYQDKFYLHNGILEAQTDREDWSERQKFLREAVREIIKDKPIIFAHYLHMLNYHYYILNCLYITGHDYLKAENRGYACASKLIRAICNRKKEDVKLFLENCIKSFKEKPPKDVGTFNCVEFTTALSSESAMKIWETLIENNEFIWKAIDEDRILLLKTQTASSKETNKKIETLLGCFKNLPDKIPKPLQLIIAGKALEIYSPVF